MPASRDTAERCWEVSQGYTLFAYPWLEASDIRNLVAAGSRHDIRAGERLVRVGRMRRNP
jgi:hypothetical protein